TPARVWEWLQHGKMQLATCRQLAVYRKSRRDVQDFGEQVLLDARWPHGAGVRRHPHIDPFFKTVPSNPFTAIFHLHIQRSWEDSVNPCPCPGKIGILVGLHIVREIFYVCSVFVVLAHNRPGLTENLVGVFDCEWDGAYPKRDALRESPK